MIVEQVKNRDRLLEVMYEGHFKPRASPPKAAVKLISAFLEYFPYGKVLREFQNGDQERYLTTQHERDQETGLDYRGARYYDGDVGRFLSLDPLALKYPEWSDYHYVLGNPLMYVDPTGKSSESTGGEGTGWTENHLYLNSVFGDHAGGNSIIQSRISKNQQIDYQQIAEKLGVEANVIEAIVSVESSGSPFNKSGGPTGRYEGHWALKFARKEGLDVEQLKQDYPLLLYSYSEGTKLSDSQHGMGAYLLATFILGADITIKSTSWGAFQIMGFNYEQAGYDSPMKFMEAQTTMQGQVESFVNFVSASPVLLKAMRAKDFETFTRNYNGDAAVERYSTRMRNAYNKLN